MESLFVFVENHRDKKTWCTASTKGILSVTTKNSRAQIKAVNWNFVDWRQSYSRQSHILGIKSFIVNGVHPSLIPVLTYYCRSRSMKVKLLENTSKSRNMPGSGAIESTTMPIVFQRKTATNFSTNWLSSKLWKWSISIFPHTKQQVLNDLPTHSNLRKFPFPQGFQKSKMVGHWTSRSEGKKTIIF